MKNSFFLLLIILMSGCKDTNSLIVDCPSSIKNTNANLEFKEGRLKLLISEDDKILGTIYSDIISDIYISDIDRVLTVKNGSKETIYMVKGNDFFIQVERDTPFQHKESCSIIN